ncbi:MAG TPA: PTS glucose transporter subunit IIA [Clostridiaceae bacterium]
MGTLIKLYLPIKGSILPLSEVNDYLFSKKIMGEGLAIKPEDNFIYSPVDGEVVLIYDTKHALALKTKEGLQLLIHIGIDTVKLEGRGFASYVKVGDMVKTGDKLVFFDREFIEKKVSSITPIVITNPELIENFDINYKANNNGDLLAEIRLK